MNSVWGFALVVGYARGVVRVDALGDLPLLDTCCVFGGCRRLLWVSACDLTITLALRDGSSFEDNVLTIG
jgi:hypothetical protein